MSLLDKLTKGGKKIKILDIGGTEDYWNSMGLNLGNNIEIVLLNLYKIEVRGAGFSSIKGDACNLEGMADKSFDLVFSNSVIEHLYTLEQQQKMASEIRRVGKSYFIQTPNVYFPIEAHYAMPFAQYYPKAFLHFILTQTKFSRLKKWSSAEASQYIAEIRLLNSQEMKALFPGTSLLKEKVLGLTKSITAHNLV